MRAFELLGEMNKGGAIVFIFPLCEYVSQFHIWIIRVFQFFANICYQHNHIESEQSCSAITVLTVVSGLFHRCRVHSRQDC